jgi:hypothetical protein
MVFFSRDNRCKTNHLFLIIQETRMIIPRRGGNASMGNVQGDKKTAAVSLEAPQPLVNH